MLHIEQVFVTCYKMGGSTINSKRQQKVIFLITAFNYDATDINKLCPVAKLVC